MIHENSPASPNISGSWNLLIALESWRGLMCVQDVADLLGKSACTVYRMAQQKKIPSMVVGGERRFDPSVLAMHFGKKHPEMVAAARAIRAAARII